MEKIPVAAERRPADTQTTPTHNPEAPQHLSHGHRPLTLTRSSLVWGKTSSRAGNAVTHREERVEREQGSKGPRFRAHASDEWVCDKANQGKQTSVMQAMQREKTISAECKLAISPSRPGQDARPVETPAAGTTKVCFCALAHEWC